MRLSAPLASKVGSLPHRQDCRSRRLDPPTILLSALMFSFIASNLPAQTQVWCRRFSHPMSTNSVAATEDGRLLFAGRSTDYSVFQCVITCVDAGGNLQWIRSSSSPGDVVVTAMRRTPDGGLVLAGTATFFGMGSRDGLVIKLSNDGQILWQRTVGDVHDDEFLGLAATDDGGCVAVGGVEVGSRYEQWAVRFTADGQLLWERIYRSNAHLAYGGYLSSVDEASDGSLYVAGPTHSNGWAAVMKLDPDGTVLWTRNMRGTSPYGWYEMTPTSILATGHLGCVVAGHWWSYEVGAWMASLDADGNVMWNNTQTNRRFEEVQTTADGGYILVGSTRDPASQDRSVLLERTDELGQPTWTYAYGSSDLAFADIDEALSMARSADGYYFGADTGYASNVMKVGLDGIGCHPAQQTFPMSTVDSSCLYDVSPPTTIPSVTRVFPSGITMVEKRVDVQWVCNTSTEGPVIRSVTGRKLLPKQNATILGQGFSSRRNGNFVYFGRKRADIVDASPGRLTVRIPKGAYFLVPVYVVANRKASNIVAVYLGY